MNSWFPTVEKDAFWYWELSLGLGCMEVTWSLEGCYYRLSYLWLWSTDLRTGVLCAHFCNFVGTLTVLWRSVGKPWSPGRGWGGGGRDPPAAPALRVPLVLGALRQITAKSHHTPSAWFFFPQPLSYALNCGVFKCWLVFFFYFSCFVLNE